MSIQKQQIDNEKWFNFHNHWSKIKGNYHFDVYENDNHWVWKLRLNNAGIDYTLIEKGITKTFNEAIQQCDNAFINRLKNF